MQFLGPKYYDGPPGKVRTGGGQIMNGVLAQAKITESLVGL